MTFSLNAAAQFGLGQGSGSSQPLPYPLINGFAYSYASIEASFVLPGQQTIKFKGWASVNYKAPLEEVKLWGFAQEPIARTIGKIDFQGDCEIYKAEASYLITKLGPGWTAITFDLTMNYRTSGFPMVTDTCYGCRLISPENGVKSGDPAGLTTKFGLPHMSQKLAGVAMVPFPLAGQ